jgi:hypothetical protein
LGDDFIHDETTTQPPAHGVRRVFVAAGHLCPTPRSDELRREDRLEEMVKNIRSRLS